MFYCNFFVSCPTVLPDLSISTVDSNTFLGTIMVCHHTTTVIEYALSHSIGINVANVSLKCVFFGGFVTVN